MLYRIVKLACRSCAGILRPNRWLVKYCFSYRQLGRHIQVHPCCLSGANCPHSTIRRFREPEWHQTYMLEKRLKALVGTGDRVTDHCCGAISSKLGGNDRCWNNFMMLKGSEARLSRSRIIPFSMIQWICAEHVVSSVQPGTFRLTRLGMVQH